MNIQSKLVLAFAFLFAASFTSCQKKEPDKISLDSDLSRFDTKQLVDTISKESIGSYLFEYIHPEIVVRGDEALPYLEEHLQSRDYTAKKAAVFLLGKINTEKSIDLLLPFFENDRHQASAFWGVTHSGRERVYQALKRADRENIGSRTQLLLLRALHYHSDSGNFKYLEELASDFVNAETANRKGILRYHLRRMVNYRFQTEEELFERIQKLKERQQNDEK